MSKSQLYRKREQFVARRTRAAAESLPSPSRAIISAPSPIQTQSEPLASTVNTSPSRAGLAAPPTVQSTTSSPHMSNNAGSDTTPSTQSRSIDSASPTGSSGDDVLLKMLSKSVGSLSWQSIFQERTKLSPAFVNAVMNTLNDATDSSQKQNHEMSPTRRAHRAQGRAVFAVLADPSGLVSSDSFFRWWDACMASSHPSDASQSASRTSPSVLGVHPPSPSQRRSKLQSLGELEPLAITGASSSAMTDAVQFASSAQGQGEVGIAVTTLMQSVLEDGNEKFERAKQSPASLVRHQFVFFFVNC
jgi:hypothetical protein